MSVQRNYTKAVGTKFYPNGSVRPYPGNTVICFIDPDSKVYTEALWAQRLVKESVLRERFAFLPSSSFHMTVFELLCDQVRKADYWSDKLSLSCSLAESDLFFKETLAETPFPQNFEMCIDRIEVEPNFTIWVKPASTENEKRLRTFRDRLSEQTGIRFPDHENYKFHVSMGYLLETLNDEEKEVAEQLCLRIDSQLNKHVRRFTTGRPQLTLFHDMFEFLTTIQR